MKTYFYLFTVLFLFSQSLVAQESEAEKSHEPGNKTLLERLTGKDIIDNSEMTLHLFTSANANFSDSQFDGMNFKLNRVRLEIKGSLLQRLSYRYRQSFNKDSDPYSLDNTSSSLELAYVNLKVNDKFSFTIGKQFVNFGGYEFYVNSIKVREFSIFNSNLSCYQVGLTGNWQINSNQELLFQVANNQNGDYNEMYASGLPTGVEETKIPFIYSVNWNSYYFDKVLQLRYAAAIGQQAKKNNVYYLTFGNSIEKGPLIAYLDVMYSRQNLDQHGLISTLPSTSQTARYTEYLSFIGNIDYRFHPRWNAYIKGGYETGRVYKANGNFAKGMFGRTWNVQSSLEFYPLKDIDLFVFLHYTYRGIQLTDNALRMGAYSPDTHRLSLGFVYSIPVF